MITLTNEMISNFSDFTKKHQSFIICGHKEPDGDCVASSIGVSRILQNLGKSYLLLNAGPFKRIEIAKYANQFSREVPFMSNQDRQNTGLIIVDCSEFPRLGDLSEDLQGLDTFIIDHHKTASVIGDNTIIDPTCPACVLLVQQLYENLVGPVKGQDAHDLFFGMATDTGFFRFLKDDSASVFGCASRLVQGGADPRSIYTEMTAGKSWNTRKLLGLMLTRAERYCNGKLVITYETMEDTRKLGQEGRDSDALYSQLLATKDVEAVVFLRQETDHNCTAGFRSQDKCDVSLVAAKFGGGGHKNASGASIEGRIETLIPAIAKEFSKIL